MKSSGTFLSLKGLQNYAAWIARNRLEGLTLLTAHHLVRPATLIVMAASVGDIALQAYVLIVAGRSLACVANPITPEL